MQRLIERYDTWRSKFQSRLSRRTPANEESAAGRVLPDANRALAMQEFSEGITTVSSTPIMLTLESTSRCNLRCVMCTHSIGAVHRPKHLDTALPAKLTTFLKRAGAVQLHGIGEPTNSPAFWRLLENIPPPDVCESSINSNFTVMDEGRINRILNSNLRLINVSLDAGTALTYKRIRGFSFEVVIGNIERLIQLRGERGQTYPLVYMNMTLMRSNVEEIGDFIRLAARVGVNGIQFWHLNHWPDEEMARFATERDGWQFDYRREGLWNHAVLSNRCVREGIELAKELNVELHLDPNKEIYFEHDEAA